MPLLTHSIYIVRTTRSGLSSMSSVSAQAIARSLESQCLLAVVVIIDSEDDLYELVQQEPSIVVLGMKYLITKNGDKLWLADFFSERGIPTTGSNSAAHKLELDKSLAKRRIQHAGLQTSPFYVAGKNHNARKPEAMNFPLFVKPTDRGGGVGIDSYSVVHTSTQLSSKIASISLRYNADSLVEQYLSGREFSVAIIRDLVTGSYTAMPIELVAPLNHAGARLLSSAVKGADAETVTKVSDPDLNRVLQKFAIDIFIALGGRDYGRIDIRLDGNGTPNFLEANLIPSLIDNYGSFPKACLLYMGLSHEQMIAHIAILACDRIVESAEISIPVITK